jgi:hypothetical protein
MNVFFYKIKKGEIFVDRKPIAMFCSKFNKLSCSRLIDWPDIRLFKVSGIRPDTRPSNPVSGRIPDLKKGRIIRPDIRPTGYPVHPYIIHVQNVSNHLRKTSDYRYVCIPALPPKIMHFSQMILHIQTMYFWGKSGYAFVAVIGRFAQIIWIWITRCCFVFYSRTAKLE